jgi:hypothetical protein
MAKNKSDEAFNAGKEIEAMNRLTLHRIASSLLLPSFGPVFLPAVCVTLCLERLGGGGCLHSRKNAGKLIICF